MNGLVLIISGGLILTIADIILKYWVSTNNVWLLVLGLLVYVTGDAFLAFSFRYKNIAVASAMFVLINVIALMVVSYFVFDEPLTKMQLIGIGFGLMSILFMEL